MKKYSLLSLVGLCTIMLCSGLLLFACDKGSNNNSSNPQTPSHTHVGEWVETTHATCTTDGLRTFTCTVCGYTDQATIAKLEHLWSKYETTGLVVNECNGTHTRRCLRPNCGEVESGECIYTTITYQPTCEDKGYNIHTCQICHDSFRHDEVDAIGHNFVGTPTYVGLINGKHIHRQVCSHDLKHVQDTECRFEKTKTVALTCTTNGYEEYTCQDCGYSYQTNIQQAQGHQYNNNTWTFKGDNNNKYHERKCDNCDYVESQPCQPAVVTSQAQTCTQHASYTLRCSVCQNEEERITQPARGHVYGDYIHNKSADSANSKHYKQCLYCEDRTEEEACVFVDNVTDATCTASGQTDRHCKDCQATYTEGVVGAVGHKYDNVEWQQRTNAEGQYEHYRLCSVCGEGEQAYLCSPSDQTQTYQAPDCTNTGLAKQTCQTCGQEISSVVIPALGHLYNEDEWEIDAQTGHHKQQCQRANCDYLCDEAHTYSQTNLCDKCGNDGLIYEIVDGHAIVVSDDNVLSAKTIIIPEQHDGSPVTEIADMYDRATGKARAFYNNSTVEYVILPKSLVKIGTYAFNNCSKLKGVSITTENAELEPQLTTIDDYAFSSCGQLQSADLPSSVKTLGVGCFNRCTNLSHITLPDEIETIGDHAFADTKYVKDGSNWSGTELYIGKHLVSVYTGATGTVTINPGTLYICSEAFENCNQITKVVIPDSIKEINIDAFIGCTALEEVEYLGTFMNWLAIKFDNDAASPMSYASKLTISGATGDIVIPDEVTSIPAGAFKGSSITSVKLHANVTYIGEEAFENCTQLQTITVDPNCNLKFVGTDALKNTPYFNTSANWTQHVLYLGHALVAVQEGINADYVVLEGTVSISPKAFSGYTLNSIILPESLVYIGERAFENCTLNLAQFKGYTGWFANNRAGAGRSVKQDSIKSLSSEAASLLTYWNLGYWRRTI